MANPLLSFLQAHHSNWSASAHQYHFLLYCVKKELCMCCTEKQPETLGFQVG